MSLRRNQCLTYVPIQSTQNDKNMKHITSVEPLVLALLMVGCLDYKSYDDVLLYGNNFIHLDNTELDVPRDWNTHEFMHGTF